MKATHFGQVLFILLLTHWSAWAYDHPGGMHTQAQITLVKKHISTKTQPYYDAYLQLLAHADSALTHPTHALADFKVPGFYVDAEGHRRNSRSLQSDAFDAYACALAWQLSGHNKYGQKALDILNTWATTNTTYSEADGSLVMAYSGTAMVIAGDLLYHYPAWKAQEREKYLGWVRNVYRKACDEIRGRKNNWADWGRLGSALCAQLLDDPAQLAENSRLVKSDLFHKIAEDGHMPEETRRGSNGIWYTYFSLAPITATCQVLYNSTGENLFRLEEKGVSMKKALDYLYHYNLHPEAWSWFKDPRPGSPGNWPGNLFEAMGVIYGEEKYRAYAQPARPVCIDKHHFAWSFPTLMPPTVSMK
ncbi:hypothetical protein GCM10027275_04280 [Rhabdobacter roseus]|uniref:Alginate lyase domain-containing protein n=1 Tax=Rhabdobacter roseus TaxID=1655419 RepID=A0A840TRF6_9BACT|nr:alginate lyase family protein [Rhabdobacter roseus]MBB5282319.1 hypothetical protein [Rhabdobacter roseus]